MYILWVYAKTCALVTLAMSVEALALIQTKPLEHVGVFGVLVTFS